MALGGRFMTDITMNFLAMKTTLLAIWRPVKGLYIRAQKQNLFVFKFFHKLDMGRVIKGGPWTFDRHVLIMKRMEDEEEASEVEPSQMELWVQVLDLPTRLQSERVLTTERSRGLCGHLCDC